MSDLIPTNRLPMPAHGSAVGVRLPRLTAKGLARLEHQTTMRLAGVQAEALVQGDKLDTLDSLSRKAMTGQAMLRRWADTLAAGDPFLADELKFFSDVARMGKGEIIADTISRFSREGR